MPPEYIWESMISPMADIYSLGVIIIEIITGRKYGPSGTETFCKDFVESVRNSVPTFKLRFFNFDPDFIIAQYYVL